MSDIDATHQRRLMELGLRLAKQHIAGIGNECTHWIYAALLEARALDLDGVRLRWGRRVPEAAAIPGDIVQFHNFHNRFEFWFRETQQGSRTDIARAPRHTAMIAGVSPVRSHGEIVVFESHVTQAGYARMTVRENRVYTHDFAIALSHQQFAELRRTKFGITFGDLGNHSALYESLSRRMDWLGVANLSPSRFSAQEINAAFRAIDHTGSHVSVNPDIALLARCSVRGQVEIYRPQRSESRLAMNAEAFQAEKQRVIAMMHRTGRRGHDAHEDEFGNDNRQFRWNHGYFNW